MRDRAAAPRAGNRSLTARARTVRSILSLFRARNAAHVARSERYLRHGVCDKYESDLNESGGTGGRAESFLFAPWCSGRDIISIRGRRRYYTNKIAHRVFYYRYARYLHRRLSFPIFLSALPRTF